MKHVLVLGAGGQIARLAVAKLALNEQIALTLLLRRADQIRGQAPAGARIVQADVLDSKRLEQAMAGQDLVYANLAGEDLDLQAVSVVNAMKAAGVARLIFVASLGIYDEVPGRFGNWNRQQIGAFLPPYRRAADAVEASGLDFTVLRPAWLSDRDEVDYETTDKGSPFKGTEVSRKSVADLIVRIITDPRMHSRANVGVNKPNTDGDRPSFL